MKFYLLFISLIIFGFVFYTGTYEKISYPFNNYKTGTLKLNITETIKEIPIPNNYTRIDLANNSFGSYLRNLTIKLDDNIVYLFSGKPKNNQSAQFCVINMDVGNRDLQQCADAVIRLRAEYLFLHGKFNKIHFNFTSGDTAFYTKYAEGFRANVIGNDVTWEKKVAKDTSYKVFRNYMNLVFTYAGTTSLSKELINVRNMEDIFPGDVFIQIGQPYGHAVIVIDVAIHRTTGEKIFLLAQSFMPAQEIHVLKNPSNNELNPWYSVNFNNKLQTPEWTFYKNDLKRFK